MPLYLEIDGLEGPVAEVPGIGLADVFTIEGFSHGLNQSYGPEGAFARTTGSANVQLLNVQKKVDGSTPLLMQTLCQNDHYEEVNIYDAIALTGGELHQFMKITMRHVSVADIQYSGFTEGEAQETVSFRFSEIVWDIDPLDKETGEALGVRSFEWSAEASGTRT
jgi:type VI secretion system Hcp family effector